MLQADKQKTYTSYKVCFQASISYEAKKTLKHNNAMSLQNYHDLKTDKSLCETELVFPHHTGYDLITLTLFIINHVTH